MTNLSEASKDFSAKHYAESELGMWDSNNQKLQDPKAIEPVMYLATAESNSGWGFHGRAELLNGRLAMIGFASGVLLEAISGKGILEQIGLAALLHQG